MYKEKACRIKNIRQALSNYDSNNTYLSFAYAQLFGS